MDLKKFKEELTQDKIDEYHKKYEAYLDANKERIVDIFIRSVWRGIGKLEGEAARKVYQEVSAGCAGVYTPFVLEVIGFEGNTSSLDLESIALLNDIAENIIGGGKSKVTVEGNVVTDVSYFSECGCPFVDHYRIVDHNHNQCLYCTCEGYARWYEHVLKKPVKVEMLSSIKHGGKCCSWRIEVQDSQK
jgi:hypothetical protein